MKRLIPAAIILIFTIIICIYGHLYIEKACDNTLDDIENFYNRQISSYELEKNWLDREKNMAIFVNNGHLDKITVYIGRLTVTSNKALNDDSDIIRKDIESVLSLIKEEQTLTAQCFY